MSPGQVYIIFFCEILYYCDVTFFFLHCVIHVPGLRGCIEIITFVIM